MPLNGSPHLDDALRRPSLRVPPLVATAMGSLGLLVLGTSPAMANPNGESTLSVGAGTQTGKWQLSGRTLRMIVRPTSDMNPDRCMDSLLDWDAGTPHYDGRVVRSCRPGSSHETDANNDGWWVEPSDWDGGDGIDMKKGFGYIIDDDDLSVFSNLTDKYSGTSSNSFYTTAPATTTSCWARTTTRYHDGHVDWTPNLGKDETDGSAGSCL